MKIDWSKPYHVGTFTLGHEWVDLKAISDLDGGDYTFAPKDKRPAEIRVGLDRAWDVVLNYLLHESFEFLATKLHFRFTNSISFFNDHGGYIFVFNHPQFSDIIARQAWFLDQSQDKLKKVWKKFHADRKRKATKR